MSRRMVSDEQWERIKGHLPGRAGTRGRSGVDNRLFVDAILWMAGNAVRWRDLPEVPDSAVLDCRRAVLDTKWDRNTRLAVARVITLKMPAVLLKRAVSRGSPQDEWFYYSTMQVAFDSVEQAIDGAIVAKARRDGRPSFEVGGQLFNDEDFLNQVAAWIEVQDWTDAMGGDLLVPAQPLVPQ